MRRKLWLCAAALARERRARRACAPCTASRCAAPRQRAGSSPRCTARTSAPRSSSTCARAPCAPRTASRTPARRREAGRGGRDAVATAPLWRSAAAQRRAAGPGAARRALVVCTGIGLRLGGSADRAPRAARGLGGEGPGARLAAHADDQVAAAVLLHQLAALGAGLGVGGQPVLGLAVVLALDLPAPPPAHSPCSMN